MDTISLAGPLPSQAARDARRRLLPGDAVGARPGRPRRRRRRRGARGARQRPARHRLPGAARLRGPVRPPARLQGRRREGDARDVPRARLADAAGRARRPPRMPPTTATRLPRDLRKLAMLAVPLGIRIAYEALSWGRTINEFPAAWDVVVPRRHAQPRHRHRFVPRRSPPSPRSTSSRWCSPTRSSSCSSPTSCGRRSAPSNERIDDRAPLPRVPRRRRAQRALAELVQRLDALGYRGDYSFEVFNDDYQQMAAATVAERARRCAIWLAEDVLKRAVPRPWSVRLKRLERA